MYEQRADPVGELQLEKAGVRLPYLMNANVIYDIRTVQDLRLRTPR